MVKGKVVLITGGAGSIGSEIVKHVLEQEPAQVRIFSRDESKQHALFEGLDRPKNMRLLIGDVRDKDRLKLAFSSVDVVFHTAALKHVPACEYNPFEAVHTNIIGSQNVIEAAIANNVDRVVAVSTDKVVDPISIMGTTKLMMEKLVINANYYYGSARTTFSCVRFGNVAWARGSVLPLWKDQAERNGEIMITNENMTRFMMSIKEASGLVVRAGELMAGGEIFVLKMPSITLSDLAKEFVAKYYPDRGIRIRIIGDRAGEKVHEGLLGPGNGEVLENERMFINIPHFGGREHFIPPERSYPGFTLCKNPERWLSSDHIDIDRVRSII